VHDISNAQRSNRQDRTSNRPAASSNSPADPSSTVLVKYPG
jgi:hypothetical protein